MRVLIVSETFPPLLRASGRIMKDLAVAFRDNGHEVCVLTVIEDQLHYKYISTGLLRDDGFDVLRIRTLPQRDVGYFRRGIAEILLPFIITSKTLKAFRNKSFDLIIVHTPPISLCHLIRVLKKKSACPVYLVLRDIHPQTGVDLSIFKENGIVYRYFRWIEKRLYALCDVIAAQSPANRDFILKKNPHLESHKVSVLYNFKIADEAPVISVNFKERFGVKDKIVCLYGGNITSSQDLKELLCIAEKCIKIKEVVFLVIGFGKEKEMLLQKTQEKGLTNVIFENPLPLDSFTSLVYQCDIGLMFLNKKFTTHNFPGKMLDYMNASLPIVASVNKNNDIKKLIEDDAKCGFVHYEEDPEGVAESIKILAENPKRRKMLGENGRIYLENELNAQKAFEKIVSDLSMLKIKLEK